MAAAFCFLMCGFSITAYAGYTKVGTAASQDYVYSSDDRPVIIFVGDSRAMMCTYPKGKTASRSNFCFCWVNGGNVSVIRSSGSLTPHVTKMIERYRDRCVVALNLGVNGNSNPKSNANRIIKQYRRWMSLYPDVQFFVVSVNPTRMKNGPYSNNKVIQLNTRLKEEFEPDGLYIDTYTPLMESGLVTGNAKGMRDMYHYKWSASRRILSLVRKAVTASRNQTA